MTAAATLRGPCGIGLRAKHYREIFETGIPGVECVEAISENFLGRGGRPLAVLERLRRELPVFLHGVSLSVGGVDELDPTYLRALRTLCHRVEPALVSDHLCFGGWGGHRAHDLWPLPYSEEAISHVIQRVARVQELLGRRLLLENVSSYVGYTASTMPEWEFLAEVARRADCLLLLDLNNIYVSAHNHGFSADDYLDGVPVDRVAQCHLAGHLDKGDYLLDNHGAAVPDAVWALYRKAVRRLGAVPVIIEWDENVPALEQLVSEATKARGVQAEMSIPAGVPA